MNNDIPAKLSITALGWGQLHPIYVRESPYFYVDLPTPVQVAMHFHNRIRHI